MKIVYVINCLTCHLMNGAIALKITLINYHDLLSWYHYNDLLYLKIIPDKK